MNLDVHRLLAEVSEAKKDPKACDRMIEQYMPFIRSETAKFLKRSPMPEDDELSIAMFAFYEAIRNYSPVKGAFFRFAALQIRSRLIDNYRREKRNQGHVSLDTPIGNEEDGLTLMDTVQDESRPLEELGVLSPLALCGFTKAAGDRTSYRADGGIRREADGCGGQFSAAAADTCGMSEGSPLCADARGGAGGIPPHQARTSYKTGRGCRCGTENTGTSPPVSGRCAACLHQRL